MSQSDWLQIVLSLIGFFLGAIVSWVFYRAQQNTDFNKLREEITKVTTALDQNRNELRSQSKKNNEFIKRAEATLNEVLKATVTLDVNQKFDELQDYSSIREKVDIISTNLGKVVEDIMIEVRGSQEIMFMTLQEKFDEQTNASLKLLEDSLRQELKSVLKAPSDIDMVLSKSLQVIENAIKAMGQYQQANMDQQADQILSAVEEKFVTALDEVVSEVSDLKEQVASLPLLLPPPPPPRNDSSTSLPIRNV